MAFAMQLVIDRTLPVSLRSQLHGLIEYGISCGDLSPGETLPSVRELAETLGVAPMTVAQVYADLKAAGLVETRPGAGTFVSHRQQVHAVPGGELSTLYGQIDALIEQSRRLGMRSVDLMALISGRVSHGIGRDQRRRLLMVGLFGEATESYARFLADRLGPEVIVEPVTVPELESDPAIRARAGTADLVVTLVNKQQQVEALLPETRVVAIRFTPSQETRRSLASLESLERIAAVSRFPEFLPILKSGVTKFAPHVADVAADTIGSPGLAEAISRATVLVYATGAEAILAEIAPDMPRIEYRHAPDTADIERVVVPALRLAGREPGPDVNDQSHSDLLQKEAT
ncbi:GntR family transcriptional regulator [Rhizobium sp. SSA_523]|uniref:GntR family transcriptional regulator n=1 Tax=Rhizobium sp. SSA_523 TaxID=2952477 RepID=UPI002091A65C|nr:GntR family transcriptional regulator [Rhizobium sp. SSA_523]MCO5733386.1 GntR family transcriptional regulator [Rhizobium sp. SSA_523]WKC21639.1 GntR family transcriptional regulator [Rhizobium sp. SSA_523]